MVLRPLLPGLLGQSAIQEPAGNVTVTRDVIYIRELENALFEDGKAHCMVKWIWQ